MSLWLAALIVLAAGALAGLAFVFLDRTAGKPIVPEAARGGPTLIVSGALFAVVLAFVTLAAFQTYNTSKIGAQTEADAVLDMARTAALFPPSQRDQLRRAGELILTHQYELEPGASELIVDGETIALDPTLNPSENAQAYFAGYRKAREAEERVPELLEGARQRAAHLAELRTLVEVASDMNAIRALRREVSGGHGPPARKGKATPKSASLTLPEGGTSTLAGLTSRWTMPA